MNFILSIRIFLADWGWYLATLAAAIYFFGDKVTAAFDQLNLMHANRSSRVKPLEAERQRIRAKQQREFDEHVQARKRK
jgi:hypothetical protein